MKHEFWHETTMILQLIWHSNVNHPHTRKKKKITKPRSIRVKYSWTHVFTYEAWYTGSTLSASWCSSSPQSLAVYRLFPRLDLYSLASQTHSGEQKRRVWWTAHTMKSYRLFHFLQKWVWLARLVSILGSLVAISLLPLSSIFHFAFCDSTDLCIFTLDWQARTVVPERQQTDQPTCCARACLGGSKCFKGGPNASKGVQILL